MSDITTNIDRAEELTDTRSVILNQAAQLFAKHGYQATTMTMVAEHSQIKKQSLFYYFRSKSLLCEMALQWFIQKMESRLTVIIHGSQTDFLLKVKHVQHTLQSLLLTYEGHYLPLTLVTELALQQRIHQHYTHCYQLMADLWHQADKDTTPDLTQKITLQLFGLLSIARLLKPLEIETILSQIMRQIVDT